MSDEMVDDGNDDGDGDGEEEEEERDRPVQRIE